MPGSPVLDLERCSLCSGHAIARLIDPDRRLCATHFTRDCESRVRAAIKEGDLIVPGDQIAVGLSGGKDSTLLLVLLHQILSLEDGVRLIAITVDEGIAGYREETMEAAVELTRSLGIEHRIVSFTDLFGADLDTLLSGRGAEACTVCGVLRRRALAVAAAEAKATKIATGHNADDEAQSVLMNVLRGDLPRLVLDTSEGLQNCFVPRIKPLSVLSEKEITTYLLVTGAFPDLPECPYAGGALRGEVREILTDLEFHYPGTIRRLIRSREEVRGVIGSGSSQGELQRCGVCGEVSSAGVCSVCRVLGR